jgi:dihydropteroate synthase
MHLNPTYTDVVAEVRAYLAARLATCEAAGITREQLVVDPGIGFGKNQEHSLALLRHLDQLVALQRPVLLGVSRKGFIGLITGRERHERMAGTLAVNCFCAALATAHILRVHDVAPTVDAAKLYAAIHGEHPSLR